MMKAFAKTKQGTRKPYQSKQRSKTKDDIDDSESQRHLKMKISGQPPTLSKQLQILQ